MLLNKYLKPEFSHTAHVHEPARCRWDRRSKVQRRVAEYTPARRFTILDMDDTVHTRNHVSEQTLTMISRSGEYDTARRNADASQRRRVSYRTHTRRTAQSTVSEIGTYCTNRKRGGEGGGEGDVRMRVSLTRPASASTLSACHTSARAPQVQWGLQTKPARQARNEAPHRQLHRAVGGAPRRRPDAPQPPRRVRTTADTCTASSASSSCT